MDAALITLATAMRLPYTARPAVQRAFDHTGEHLHADRPSALDSTALCYLLQPQNDGVLPRSRLLK